MTAFRTSARLSPFRPRFSPLGKITPRLDARTLRFEAYAHALPPVPAAQSWAAKIQSWGTMGNNDTIGDCTCAAAGHLIECWTANAGVTG